MTSEATAKLISASGLAATELTPFAASAAVGDAASLAARIRSLESVPALAEFARLASSAVTGRPSPSRAEYAARSIENLQVAATVLLRHLHCADSLQSIGSEHSVWVRLPTRLPLADFAVRVSRVQGALDALAGIPTVGGVATLEAADVGPLWFKVGLGSAAAFELTYYAIRSATTIRARRTERTNQVLGLDTLEAKARSEAEKIALQHPGRAGDLSQIESISRAVVQIVRLNDDGVEFHLTASV